MRPGIDATVVQGGSWAVRTTGSETVADEGLVTARGGVAKKVEKDTKSALTLVEGKSLGGRRAQQNLGGAANRLIKAV